MVGDQGIKVGDRVHALIKNPGWEQQDIIGTVLQEAVGPIDGRYQKFLIVQQDGKHRNVAPAVLMNEVLEVNGIAV